MEQVTLTKNIDKENKFWGLKLLGLLSGFVSGFIAAVTYGLIIGSFALLGGYVVGAYLSGLWHTGVLQRALYWGLPTIVLSKLPGLGGSKRYLPPSHIRKFM